MDDGQAVSQLVPVDALGARRVAAQSDEAEFQTDGTSALEEFAEQRGDHESDDESEENIMGDHPPVGREACETTVEEHNGDFDEADRHEEDQYTDEPKLE